MNGIFKNIGRMMHAPKGFLLGAILCILPLTGCVSYQDQAREIHAHYHAGDFDTAQAALTRKANRKAKGKDALIWRLEEASALRVNNRLEDSTRSFEIADQMIRDFEDNSASFHLGQETLSAFSNPANITYEGWTTDRIMVSTYLGVHNIIQGNEDAARIHLNKAYQRQRDAVTKNAKSIEKEQEELRHNNQSGKAISNRQVNSTVDSLYSDLKKLQPIADYVNPFTSYIRGLFFLYYATDSGDLDIALKSLQQAAAFTPGNSYVKQDLALAESFAAGEGTLPDVTYVIFESGSAPWLEQERIDLNLPIDKGIYSFNVAFPIFMPQYGVNTLQVRSGSEVHQTQMLADMNRIFGTDFQRELPRIVARTIATVVLRQAASIAANQALKNTGNDTAQVLGGLAILAAQFSVNIADTRSWTLLPQNFQICRIPTPKDGRLTLVDGRQNAVVNLPPGHGPNLVFVKSPGHGTTRMIIWSRKLGSDQ